jgi:hypothetical protein
MGLVILVAAAAKSRRGPNLECHHASEFCPPQEEEGEPHHIDREQGTDESDEGDRSRAQKVDLRHPEGRSGQCCQPSGHPDRSQDPPTGAEEHPRPDEPCCEGGDLKGLPRSLVDGIDQRGEGKRQAGPSIRASLLVGLQDVLRRAAPQVTRR